MYHTHALILGCTPVRDDPQSVQMHASIMALLLGCWTSAGISDLAASLGCFPLACNAFSLVLPDAISYWTTQLLFLCARLMHLVLNPLLFHCATHAACAESIAVSLRNTHAACAVSIAVSLHNTHAACAEANNVLCRKLPAKFGDLLSEDQLKEIEELGLLADLDDQVWIS